MKHIQRQKKTAATGAKDFRRRYIIRYSLLFIVMALIIYGRFWLFGKSFVDSGDANNGDGLIQHYTALCYYAKYLREIIKTLVFDHKLVIPEWDFSIGYGSDILTTLHYYVMGDPFNVLAAAVPLRFMPVYYSFMILLRLYCAGLAFSCYCFYMTPEDRRRNMSEWAAPTASLVYIFGLYGMRAGLSHPYFINPMIYFPLLLLGVEKIMNRESPLLFMLTVCVSACSNFYFFYMLVILTVLYVLLRLAYRYGLKQIKAAAGQVMRIALYAVTGLGAGAIVFLPVMLAVFQDSRFGNSNLQMLLYPKEYYTKLPAGFISAKQAGYWCMMGYAAIVLTAVLLLFVQKRKKEHAPLKTAFVCLTVIALLPVLNWALNAFGYAAARWIWAYAFLAAYILFRMWPELLQITRQEAGAVGLGLLAFFALCFFLDNSRTAGMACGMVCAFAVLCICQMTERGRKEKLLLLTVAANIGINAYFLFSFKVSDEMEPFLAWGRVNELVMNSFDSAVARADEDNDTSAGKEPGFWRFSQDIINNNATLLSRLHSTQYYWTTSNSSIVEANDELGILGFTHNIYYDMNSRSRLTALANVKYYVTNAGRAPYAPYGYEYSGSYAINGRDYEVYRNPDCLPFGYTYEDILDREQFAGLTPVQKEAALFQGAYVEEDVRTMPVTEEEPKTENIPFTVTCNGDGISCQGQTFVTTEKNASVTLDFEGKENCETFLQIYGLTYQGSSPLELYQDETPFDPLNLYTEEAWDGKTSLEKAQEKYKNRNWSEKSQIDITVKAVCADGNSVARGFSLLTPNYTWYSGKEDFTVNLQYSESPKVSVEIIFPYAGIYSYRDLQIECLPIAGYEEELAQLGKEHLENVVFGEDCITGNISVSNDKLLCLTVPYAKGWTARVDGETADILKTNYMYSGLLLEAGEHEIVLVYRTPGLRPGAAISLLSFCLMFLLAWLKVNEKGERI